MGGGEAGELASLANRLGTAKLQETQFITELGIESSLQGNRKVLRVEVKEELSPRDHWGGFSFAVILISLLCIVYIHAVSS